MSEAIEKETIKQAIKPPRMWSVIFFNDDYTPMEFVMECLVQIYKKNNDEAEALMWKVHTEGKAIITQGVKEIVETKQTITLMNAQRQGHPLKVEIMEI